MGGNMYQITDKFISNLLKDYSRALVRKLCDQIESLQTDLNENSTEYKALNNAKNLHRNLIYETFRDMKDNIRACNAGLKFRKFNITPSNQQKVG